MSKWGANNFVTSGQTDVMCQIIIQIKFIVRRRNKYHVSRGVAGYLDSSNNVKLHKLVFQSMLMQSKEPSIKDVRRWGEVNQKWTTTNGGGGRLCTGVQKLKTNGVSKSVSESDHPPPPRPRASRLQYMLHFGHFFALYGPDVFIREGVSFKRTMLDRRLGGPQSQFLLGGL